MLGGRSIGPYITALSAGASDMSGWMIMGLPGSVYSTGLSAMWDYNRLNIRCLYKLLCCCS